MMRCKPTEIFFLFIYALRATYCYQRQNAVIADKFAAINKECDVLLTAFASQASNYTYCAVINAQPIHFCENCVAQYIETVRAHQKIVETDSPTNPCKQELTNRDRLDIVEGVFQYGTDLWSKGRCDSCFVEKNGTVTQELRNCTLTFLALHKNTTTCIQSHHSDKHNYSEACIECSEVYQKLNEFYNYLKDSEGDDNLCMDIVDAMNSSRTEWSQTLHCVRQTGPQLLLYISGSLITMLPVIFYIFTKKYSSRIEARLLHQKRLTEQVASTSSALSR